MTSKSELATPRAGASLELTEDELTCLRWCAETNPEGIGFLYPSVLKHGPVGEYQRLIALGLVRLELTVSVRADAGYWITDKGLCALHAMSIPISDSQQ